MEYPSKFAHKSITIKNYAEMDKVKDINSNSSRIRCNSIRTCHSSRWHYLTNTDST